MKKHILDLKPQTLEMLARLQAHMGPPATFDLSIPHDMMEAITGRRGDAQSPQGRGFPGAKSEEQAYGELLKALDGSPDSYYVLRKAMRDAGLTPEECAASAADIREALTSRRPGDNKTACPTPARPR